MRRLRTGETLALAGAVALAVLLAFDWFFLSTPDARVGAHESGIRALGWFAEVVLILTILSALALAFFTVSLRATAVPITLAVMTTLLGDMLYELPDAKHARITVNADLVRDKLKAIVEDEDLRKYIL